PAAEKAALAKGRQVLDKFNCAGCHQVQPGIYEFKTTRAQVGEKDAEKDGKTVKVPVTARDLVLGRLEEMYGTVGTDPSEYDFAGRLTKYLQLRDSQTYAPPNDNKSFAAGPPSLVNEGEKVQPVWLFQFFLNPVKIRPMAVLRMPRFNMSSDDAQALVNYFAATSKVTNPGIGLTYPYLAVPEREDAYLAAKESDDIARLKKGNVLDAR